MFYFKVNRIMLICYAMLCLNFQVSASYANLPMQHPNGWFYPAGTDKTGGYSGFHAPGYECHVGKDYYLIPGSKVYSIADHGEIIAYSSQIAKYGDKCGKPGGAFLVKYPYMNGQYFYALYGHAYLNENLKTGSIVQAGQAIGNVHDYWGDYEENKCAYNWPHLHFGIHLSTKPDPWYSGVICSNDHGWVDPFVFMNDNKALLNNKTQFQFNRNDTNGWSAGNSIYNATVEKGQWQFDIIDDPYLFGPLFPKGIATDQFKTIEISMIAGFEYGKQPQEGYIYYRAENQGFSEKYTIPIDETKRVQFDGFQKLYTATFKESLSLSQIRFDPVDKGNLSHISIDFIRLVSHFSEWQFDHSSLGWSLRNAFIQSFNNGMELYATSGDPGCTSPWLGSINTGRYKSLKLEYAVFGNSTPLQATVYFDLTDDQEGFTETLAYSYEIEANGEITSYQIPLPELHACRKIFQIRVDFYEGAQGETFQINFVSAQFKEDMAQNINGDEIYFDQRSGRKRNSQEASFATNITIHEIHDMILGINSSIQFKAYAFGCCNDQYQWDFVENPLNLEINDDGFITGNSGNQTGQFTTIVRAKELTEDQRIAEESFIVSVNDDPNQQAIRVHNDGAGVLELNDIVIENSSQWIDISAIDFPLSIDGGHFLDLPIILVTSDLAQGNYNDQMIIHSNDSNDNAIRIPITLTITKDTIAPPAPENISAEPDENGEPGSVWIDWTNPSDISGISGIFYKIGEPPESDEDGKYTEEKPFVFVPEKEGHYRMFLWLKDGAGNSNYKHLAYIDFVCDIPDITGNISGSVIYEGQQSGMLIIDAYSYSSNNIFVPTSSASYDWNSGDKTKDYILSELPYAQYLINAFIDTGNLNGIPDLTEPQAQVEVVMSDETEDVDISLTESFPECPQWDFYKDEDAIINYLDLGMLVDHWLTTEDSLHWDPVYNLSSDPDASSGKQIINFMDLGIFVNHWLEESPCK